MSHCTPCLAYKLHTAYRIQFLFVQGIHCIVYILFRQFGGYNLTKASATYSNDVPHASFYKQPASFRFSWQGGGRSLSQYLVSPTPVQTSHSKQSIAHSAHIHSTFHNGRSPHTPDCCSLAAARLHLPRSPPQPRNPTHQAHCATGGMRRGGFSPPHRTNHGPLLFRGT